MTRDAINFGDQFVSLGVMWLFGVWGTQGGARDGVRYELETGVRLHLDCHAVGAGNLRGVQEWELVCLRVKWTPEFGMTNRKE